MCKKWQFIHSPFNWKSFWINKYLQLKFSLSIKNKADRHKSRTSVPVSWKKSSMMDRQTDRRAEGPTHCGLEQQRIKTKVLGHSLVRSLVRSHRSLICLLRPARFACALHCAHSFARSLTSLTLKLVGKRMMRCLSFLVFFLFWPIVRPWLS